MKIKLEQQKKWRNKMKRILTIALLLFSSISFAASSLTDADKSDCLTANQLATKSQNFNQADVDNASSFKACEPYLNKIDRILISNLEPIATSEDVRSWSGPLKEMGNDVDYTAESMRSDNTMKKWIYSFSTVTLMFLIVFILFAGFMTATKHQSLTNKSILYVIFTGVLSFLTYNFSSIYTFIVMHLVAISNEKVWNSADTDTLGKLKEQDYSEVGESLSSNADALANVFHSVELVNYVTEVESFRNVWGAKDLEIDKTLFASGFDIDEPTIEEFNEYYSHCKQRKYVEVDDRFGLHISNLNWSSIDNKAYFKFGGDTEDYNCDEDYFGKPTSSVMIQNNTPTLIDNFIQNNVSQKMSTELTFVDKMKNLFNSESGSLKLLIENAQDVAASNPSVISKQIILAEDASLEAEEEGIDIRSTNSFNELKNFIKMKMGTTHDYVEVDGLEPYQMVGYLGIVATQFSFSELFNDSGDADSIVSEKRDMGYNYLQPYITQTISYALQYNCSQNLSSTYEDRVEYAERFNNFDKDKKFSQAGSFSLKGDAHCYSFLEDGSIVAGGDGKDLVAFRNMIEHRFNAVNVFLDARTQASLELILDNDTLTDEIILEGLNSISSNASDALESHIILADAKQKLFSALRVIKDAYIFESSSAYDVTKPAYFYDFQRFSDGKDIEAIAIHRGLNQYDVSHFFTDAQTRYVQNANDVTDNIENSVSKMLRFECPVVDNNGNCKANVIQLNSEAFSMYLEQTLYLTAIEKSLSAASGFCSTIEKGVENTAGPVLGKARYAAVPAAIACGAAYALDGLSQVFIVPLQIASGAMTAITWIMKIMPALIDLVRHFAAYLLFVVPFLVLLCAFYYDIVTNLIRYTFSSHTDEDFDEFLSLKTTIGIAHSVVVSAFAFMFTLFVVLMILTSSIGGAAYDLGFFNYTGSILDAIILSFITTAMNAYLIYAVLFKLPVRIMNQISELFNAKGISFSEDSANFAQAFVVGFGFGAAAKFKSLSNNLDNSLRNLNSKDNTTSQPQVPLSSTTNNESNYNVQEVDTSDKDDDTEEEITNTKDEAPKKDIVKKDVIEDEGDILKESRQTMKENLDKALEKYDAKQDKKD